ncbi:MAG: J domain-containing protein [Chloroflexales bacterium]|nr:J domain-containing protein [Chloroflexales bacterium]
MPEPIQDPYAVLGLARDATAAQIKQSYFTLVRAHPPERDPETFKRIRAAYERLRDPAQRLETDMRMLQPWPVPARRRRTPMPDLSAQPADVIAAARALSDLERTDWREHYGKVNL